MTKAEKTILAIGLGCMCIGLGYKLGLKKGFVFDGDYKNWIAQPIVDAFKDKDIRDRIARGAFMYAYDSKDPKREILFLL